MVRQLQDGFGQLEADKDFMTELKKVAGDDAVYCSQKTPSSCCGKCRRSLRACGIS